MEVLVNFIIAHADQAHWIIFGLLMLAGLNVPISEDLMLIIGGMIASTMHPENTYRLFIWIFLGCYLSDWMAYGLGRFLGPRLLQWRNFKRFEEKGTLKMIQDYYHKYGFLTLLIGRFIPFGVRNCLFITAGMGEMAFTRFILADGIACFLSNAVMFSLAYSFGKHYQELLAMVSSANMMIFGTFVLILVAIFAVLLWRRYRSCSSKETPRL